MTTYLLFVVNGDVWPMLVKNRPISNLTLIQVLKHHLTWISLLLALICVYKVVGLHINLWVILLTALIHSILVNQHAEWVVNSDHGVVLGWIATIWRFQDAIVGITFLWECCDGLHSSRQVADVGIEDALGLTLKVVQVWGHNALLLAILHHRRMKYVLLLLKVMHVWLHLLQKHKTQCQKWLVIQVFLHVLSTFD